jgi:hypothetical protein
MIKIGEDIAIDKYEAEKRSRKEMVLEQDQASGMMKSDPDSSISSIDDGEFFDCQNEDVFIRDGSYEIAESPETTITGRSQTFISPKNFIQKEFPW